MANEFLTQLRKEHREVMSILEQLSDGDGKKSELFSQLKMQFIPHMKSEESAFYPVLLEKEEARSETLEGFEEHHVSELLFKEIEKMSNDDERWDAKIKVLKELVNHHVKEEERNIFKLARKELDEEQFSKILQNFEKEKQKIMKQISK